MAIADDYMTLTRVGPGTPMGNLLRRYWIPAVMSEQLTERGGAPVRTRLLGENLVAFRDPQGKLGLVGEYCPHRGASLAYALNEDGGLRCLYHGWKINGAGAIVDTPAEPPESTFAQRLCHTNYPVREAGGIVWTYMGPRDQEPVFPCFPWLDLPKSHVLVVKMFQQCNYLQGLEGDIDPAHPNYLHKDLTSADDRSWRGAGWQSINHLMYDGSPKIHIEETPYLMRVGAVRKTPDPKVNYVRVFESCAPFYSYVAVGPHESRLFKAWHPIDDVSCFTFYIHFDPQRRLDPEAIYRNWGHRTSPPDYKTRYTNDNMDLQSRSPQRQNVSGIDGAAIQDLAMQESMGPIYDRRQEHLGFSDRAVIFYRRLMLRLIKDNEDGKPLPALDPALDFQQRGASFTMPADRPWQEVLHWQEEYERSHPSRFPPEPMTARNSALVGGNALKLGLFGSNCSGGLAFTRLPERWDASWDNNLHLAKLAESAGLECLVPVARWKGFGGATNVNATALETITWACGLLAHTQSMTVFGTVHVPMIHPIVAAKQIATVDHVGRGRFGVNIVCGWNQDEFEMFGLTQDEHDDRYARGEEWWRIVNMIWSGGAAADFDGRFYRLRALEGSPPPFGNRTPIMMNAGASPAGRGFAVRNSGLHFDYCHTPQQSVARVRETKQLAQDLGRHIQVWSPASIVCRPTLAEADDYARHCVEQADWDALDHQFALYAGKSGSRSRSVEENRQNRERDAARTVLGYGGSYSIRGDADHVARELKALSDAGFDGVAMGFVNYLDELPYFVQEVIPRLERMGRRAGRPRAS